MVLRFVNSEFQTAPFLGRRGRCINYSVAIMIPWKRCIKWCWIPPLFFVLMILVMNFAKDGFFLKCEVKITAKTNLLSSKPRLENTSSQGNNSSSKKLNDSRRLEDTSSLENNSIWKKLNDLKIYVYDIPELFNMKQLELNRKKPPKIWDPNCTKNFYSAEYSFHQFLLKSPVRTMDPWLADFFYVPSYSSCFLINNHPTNLTKTVLFHEKLLNHIKTNYSYFNLSQGRDHIWIFTQKFGPKMFGNWKSINNGIFLVHSGQYTLDEFTPHKDITIPPDLSGYNFPSVFELPPKHRPSRKWLAHFGGAVLPINLTDERGSYYYSNFVRQYITEYLSKDKSFKITGTRVSTYVNDMMSSKFCLCPEGWHAWNPRPYQAVILGCIPVLLSEEIELAFEDLLDYSKFMLRVRPRDISRLKILLQSISKHRIESMQAEMEKIWKAFSYGENGMAPYMILEEIARRKSPVHVRRSYL